ncbi:hypothetical protein DFQ27_008056 [Actinomortierella ambigua]|uniref:WD40 repeat-like protein n=1 Tax=Actinomortierella ambigua TaxID=1343610 RepID=A0A9P6QKJ7_9FUNG|nr:hypothetical protein DFQ27_008056 [Actinomortierella ambigua]
MRMNLVESSHDDPRVIFLAIGSRVKVYHFATLTPTAPPTYTRELVDPRETPDLSLEKTINQIRVGHLDQDEVLVVADDAGDVCVWFTQNLSRDPLLFNVDESAWGIAIHRERSMIAISSNAHVATLFHCKADPLWGAYSEEPDTSTYTYTTTTTMGNQSSQAPQPPPPPPFQQIIRGHEHNVPSVAFSSCGQFLATASVDRSCRVWRIADGQQVARTPLGPLWGWAVQFIPDQGWIHMTLDEFRRLPKNHLWPEAKPGLGVKRFMGSDGGGGGTGGGTGTGTGAGTGTGTGAGGAGGGADQLAEHLRRHSPGMERFFRRTISTRWYAGPLEGEPDLGLSGGGDVETDQLLQQQQQQQQRQHRQRRHPYHYHPHQATTDDDGNIISDAEGEDDALDIDFYLDQMAQIIQVQMEDDLLAGDGDESLETTAGGEAGISTATTTTTAAITAPPGQLPRPTQQQQQQQQQQPTGEQSSSSSSSLLAGSESALRREAAREGPSTATTTTEQPSIHPPPLLPSPFASSSFTTPSFSSSSSSSQRPVGVTNSSTELSDIRIVHSSESRCHRRRWSRPPNEGTDQREETLRTKQGTFTTNSARRKGKAKSFAPQESRPGTTTTTTEDNDSSTCDHTGGGGGGGKGGHHHSLQCLDRHHPCRRHRRHHRRRYPTELLLCATARNIYVERCGPFVKAEQATDLALAAEQIQPPLPWWPSDDEDVYEDDTDGSHDGENDDEDEDDDENDDEEADGDLFVEPWDMDDAFDGMENESIGSGSSYDWEAAQEHMFPIYSEGEGEDDDDDDNDNDEGEDESWNAYLQQGAHGGGSGGDDSSDSEADHYLTGEESVDENATMEEADDDDDDDDEDDGDNNNTTSQEPEQASAQIASGGNRHLKRPRSAPVVDEASGEPPQSDSPPPHRQRRDSEDPSDDGDDDDDDDNDEDDDDEDEDGPVSLYPISVARGAATRGDGRSLGHLDRYDRLVVMRVVPELAIAIAASQKGTVVVLRLLSIRPIPAKQNMPNEGMEKDESTGGDHFGNPSKDTETGTAPSRTKPSTSRQKDSTTTTKPSSSSSSSSAQGQPSGTATTTTLPKQQQQQQQQQQQRRRPSSTQHTSSSSSSESRPRYVLFPEVYLPAIDPLPVPLMGVAVSPLLDAARRTTVGVLLHIVYLNGHLFSYEIRLGKQSCDPPSLDHVFL